MTFDDAIKDYLMNRMPTGIWITTRDIKINGAHLSNTDFVGFILIAEEIIEEEKMPRGLFLSFKDDCELIRKTSFRGFSNKLRYEHIHRKNGKSEKE